MRHLALITMLCLSPLAVRAQGSAAQQQNVDATPEFVFEGNVDYVDPVLRKDIGPPRVLSGTMKLASTFDSNVSGKSDAYQLVQSAEFTLDRNYVLSYEGWNNPELSSHLGITDGEAHEKDDILRFAIVMMGERLENGYETTGLVISLHDEGGVMLQSLDPLYVAPAYKEATFELIFVNPQTGEEAKATGEITMFANLDNDVTPLEDYQQLEEQIRELDEKLAAKEKLVSNLRAQLNLKDVDLAERDQKIADLQAENAQLAEEAEQLRNGEALQVMEKTNAKLLENLEKSQQAREFSAATVSQLTVRQEFLAKDNADLAQTNAKLRAELAEALAEVGELRGSQEMLARQADVSFQRTLPPLPPPSGDSTPNTSAPKAVKPSPQPSPSQPQNSPSNAPGGPSMQEMAIAALQGQPGVQVEDDAAVDTPPGRTDDVSRPSAIVDPEEAQGQWKFPLPAVAQTDNSKPRRQMAEPEVQEEEDEDASSNRMLRRGPRR